jgi:hypothetical protein
MNVGPWPRCATCDRPATCLGRYEDMPVAEYACDECCAHGCEDGRCEMLTEPPADFAGDA